ncbi:hypothetical protein AGMMS50230_01420 [Spirochaetia bacterium]|nr:hypothetical protein AGMMS50230_01420 [Spirochaetia bacterium]
MANIKSHDPIIDPCWDPVFKSIFTRDTTQSEIARKKLLSAILEEPVKELSISANEPPVSRLDQRQYATTSSVSLTPVNGPILR